MKLPDSVCVLGGAGFFEWQSYLVGVGTGILTFLCFLFIWECLARLVLFIFYLTDKGKFKFHFFFVVTFIGLGTPLVIPTWSVSARTCVLTTVFFICVR